MSGAADILLYLLLVVTALLVVSIRDLRVSVALFAVYGLALSLLWQLRGAPDVALAEAAVGAGVTTVLFLLALERTERRER